MKKLVVKTLPGRPDHLAPRKRRFRGRHLFIILVAAGLVFVAYKKYIREFLFLDKSEKTAVLAPPPPPPAEVPPLQAPSVSFQQDDHAEFEIRHKTIRSGDTLAGVLEGFDIAADFVGQWNGACKSAPLSSPREGDELIVFLGRADKQPLRVFYSVANGPAYSLRKTSDGWECLSQDYAPKSPVQTVQCRFAENFYDSCIAGGLPADLIASLADIFAYDVDVTSDFKDGDSFSVFFQEQEIEGKESKQHLVLAAEMVVGGKVFQAFGFCHPDEGWEYFDSKGASLKRAFLKSPLSYRRMISPTSYKNVKPVLKIYRPHLGIDYAAPKGTPVSAIGDGVVTTLNKRRSALAIEIRHRGGYRSVYGNLSGYSRGLSRGSIVSQGEVIGSVGTGTGGKPYLDFHFYRGRKAANLHATDFSRSLNIPKTARPEFEKTRDSYLTALRGKPEQRMVLPSGSE